MAAKASGADGGANGSARQRGHAEHHDGSSGRAFTVEQKAAVIRVRRCSPTAFYDILGLEEVKTSCSDGEIKKAYRKLSLLTHPDKNGYDGADEAFKLVSRAFQVLSDPDKKSKFDKFGGDPDSRFGASTSGQGASPFSGFARSPGGGPMFEEEISPEELFRQFFGGGGFGPFGGGMFNTGPQFVFNLGGDGTGFRVHQFGGAGPRRRPHNHARRAQEPGPTAGTALSSLLPLLFLFILPLLSSLFSSSGPSGPTFRFDAAHPPHTHQRTSRSLKLPYWVNPADVEDYGAKRWRELDKVAEQRFVAQLNAECESEQLRRAHMMQDAQGWFWHDEQLMERARKMPMKSCKRLGELGARR